MQRFDCLAKDCPLLGLHLLEASAGTGKTFSIEHIFVRLLLEQNMQVEQILTVTFTRAAVRELRARIRSNLEKAAHFLSEREAPWEYLQPHLGSQKALQVLQDAIAAFDQCQIFTIHGFCYRMLREFAYEAQTGFSIPNPEGDRQAPDRLHQGLKDFLECGLNQNLLCPEQCSLLFKEFASFEEMTDSLLFPKKGESIPFSESFERCKAALQSWSGAPIEEDLLLEDFRALEKGYRATVKGNFERQVVALARSFKEIENPQFFRELLRERGTLFEFLSPANRKVKATAPPSLHYPGFFDWASARLSALTQVKAKMVLQTLQSGWAPIAEKILSEEDYLNPDEILVQMKQAIESEPFAKRVREKYAAVIIDEFQDTDAVQWDIFRTLFLETSSLLALYLVGDPKQSIYRFRKADVYTYLSARDFLGESNVYHLDTNFRSSPPLIGALNALFSRDWLILPKINRTLPYLPVRAGASVSSTFKDQKGALHFFMGEENLYLSFVAQEIETLLPEVKELSRFAILVKDRYQAEKALDFLKERGIAAIARSHTPLGQTLAFQALRELFEAILNPRDSSASKIVLAGPFGSLSSEFPLTDWKWILEEEGLVSFWRVFFDFRLEGQTLRERMVSYDLAFYRDVLQIFEWLVLREKKQGFSFEGLKRSLADLETLSSDEGGRRRMESDQDAVQVMTLHISKGLEFDVVFALSLAYRTPEPETEKEEFDAEKLRQLYVAMTRAKRRLYVPIAPLSKESKLGATSPIELFCRHLETEGPLIDCLGAFSKRESLTYETLSPFENQQLLESKPNPVSLDFQPASLSFTPSFLSSFTSLSLGKEVEIRKPLPSEEFTTHTMPRGAETGIAIHQIFERLFSAKTPIWRDSQAVAQLVSEELLFSSLAPWKEAIEQMVQQILIAPLQGDGEFFSLSELKLEELQVEMEFIYTAPPHFIKGFIDLVFFYRGLYYLVDWKTNWLGDGDRDYTRDALEESMRSHDYYLQAALYKEALLRHLTKDCLFGGAFYFFVRGQAVLYFQPDLNLAKGCYARPLFD
jgi:exodeoxyribonuclease V beta subunit